LELAKEAEAEIRKGLRKLTKRKQEQAERQRMLEEVAALFKSQGGAE
jgi:hypothetical protein